MRFHLLAATIFAGGLFVPGLATGQEATGTGTATSTATDMQQADMEFANKAAAAGKAEVELARVGTEKATNADVKTFADRLVQDHTKANDQLTQIMQTKSMAMPAEASAEAKAEHDRITALSSNEFDREFMRHWVSSHEKGIELYSTEAETGQDPELKQFAAGTLPTLQEHLDEAKRIESSLQQVAGSETPEQQTQPAAGSATEQAAGQSATDKSGESAAEQPSTGTTATGGTTQQGKEQLNTTEGTLEGTTEQPATPDTTTAEGTAEPPATTGTTAEGTTEPPATTGTTAEGSAEQPATTAEGTAEQPTATQEAARPTYPLGDKTANDLIGQLVVNQNGDNVGEIYDIVFNASDQAVLAVVSVGGFLGIGEKNVAVPFEQLQPGDNEAILMSTASEEELKAMPEYVEAESYTALPRDRAIGDGAM
jgi:putative membrane protein